MAQYRSFTIVPRPGRGIITSRAPQVLSEFTDSVAFIQNLLLKDGSWVARPDDDALDLIAASSGPVWGIHYYNALDPTAPGATGSTVYLMHAGESTGSGGTSTLRRSDAGIVTVDGINFTTTTPSDIFFLNIKNRCFVTGCEMSTGVKPTIIQKYPSATSYAWGKAGGTSDLTYDAYLNVTNATTKQAYFQAAGAGVVNASPNVTKVGGSNWDTTWAGKTAVLDGINYGIVSVTGTGGPMTLATNYTGTTATVNILIRTGELTWLQNGPQYAYCYYNPTTGHVTNISPIMAISEKNITNVRVNVQNIPLTNDANYTKVILFRNALDGGGSLYPLKLDPSHGGSASIDNTVGAISRYMINNNAVGTVNYVDFQADSFLGQIIGPVQAPTINNPPPADIRYMAFWDQRVWVVSAATRYRLQFSGSSGQILLGVAEESFPALNFRDVPADDGFITALKVVGSSLLICTERYMYSVDGTSEFTYKLVRISSRGSGVDQYAIDEHPGDSSEQSASVVFVSRDKRLWRQFPGGRVEDIGWQIQNKLDLINLSLRKPVVIKVCQVDKSWLLALGIRLVNPNRYGYLFYDFDEQSWMDLNLGSTPQLWGVGYGGYSTAMWSGVAAGVDYTTYTSGISALDIGTDDGTNVQRIRLMGKTTVGSIFSVMNTQELDLGDKTAKKTLQEVVIHTSTTAPAKWQVAAQFDGLGTPVFFLTLDTDSIAADSPRYPGTEAMRWKLKTDATSLPAGVLPPVQFHTIKIDLLLYGSDPADKIHKLVINYTPESTGASGAGN